MNARPHIPLLAIAVLCIAAVAWAADAPGSTPAPPAPAAQLAPGAHDDAAPLAADLEEEGGDDLGLGAIDVEDTPDGGGADGDRQVIVRRVMREALRAGRMSAGMGMGAGRMGAGMGPGGFARIAQALDLSDAQREKLADIRDRQQRRAIQARADQQIARLDLRKAMRAERPDAGAINAQIDRVAKLRADMAKARVASLLEARSVLTPEQQKKARELRLHGPGAGMRGMGRGMGMGPGGMGPGGMGPGGMGMGRGRMGDDGRPMRVKVEVQRDTL